MAEQFKDSYYGRLTYDNEKVKVQGNKATVSGTDSDGKPYTNYFKRNRQGEWRFNGYSGTNGSVKSTKPKFGTNNNTTRPDNRESQRKYLNNKGK